jgi:hypothetical protein
VQTKAVAQPNLGRLWNEVQPAAMQDKMTLAEITLVEIMLAL